MRCPACRAPAIENDPTCRQCGFSLEVADRSFGIAPTLQRPVADEVGVLGRLSERRIKHIITTLERRFPQVGVAVVLIEVPPQAPLAAYAFWIFNRCRLSSAVQKGGESRLVMLLIDTAANRASAMVGYGLEPFIQETHLHSCLQAAQPPLRSGRYAQAIESFTRELERQLVEACRLVPRQFGLAENHCWLDASQPEEQAVGLADDEY